MNETTGNRIQRAHAARDGIADKLEAFRALLEAEQLRGLVDQGYNPEHHAHAVKLKAGRKYCNVDTGCSLSEMGFLGTGKYMVDLATGEIFGIKGYGVIHRGYRFGTLDTLSEWDWSGYRACKRRLAA